MQKYSDAVVADVTSISSSTHDLTVGKNHDFHVLIAFVNLELDTILRPTFSPMLSCR